MSIPSYEEILACKHLTVEKMTKDLLLLLGWNADTNESKLCGNPTLYHYQMDNLCRTSTNSSKCPHASLYSVMVEGKEGGAGKLYGEMLKRGRSGSDALRMFEVHRVNRGSVVFFKPSMAKYIYKKFGATSILDPTAGWGGRMLGAWSLGLPYVGFDTNLKLEKPYGEMMEVLGSDRFSHINVDLEMRFEDCLKADWSDISYDFVLTSPPYVNLELYEGMTPFASDNAFYDGFLIPLLNKCIRYCKPGGWVCFNISPKMYDQLIKRGFRVPDEQHDLLQQKRAGKDKQDKIYCWRV